MLIDAHATRLERHINQTHNTPLPRPHMLHFRQPRGASPLFSSELINEICFVLGFGTRNHVTYTKEVDMRLEHEHVHLYARTGMLSYSASTTCTVQHIQYSVHSY